MSEHRLDPGYAQGFWEAQDGEPLFDGASAPYRGGWEAYWRLSEMLTSTGLGRQADGSHAITMSIPSASPHPVATNEKDEAQP